MAHIESAAAVVLFWSVHKKNRCGKLQTQIVPKQYPLLSLFPFPFFLLNNNIGEPRQRTSWVFSNSQKGSFSPPPPHHLGQFGGQGAGARGKGRGQAWNQGQSELTTGLGSAVLTLPRRVGTQGFTHGRQALYLRAAPLARFYYFEKQFHSLA